jgi:hypothetical protein
VSFAFLSDELTVTGLGPAESVRSTTAPGAMTRTRRIECREQTLSWWEIVSIYVSVC